MLSDKPIVAGQSNLTTPIEKKDLHSRLVLYDSFEAEGWVIPRLAQDARTQTLALRPFLGLPSLPAAEQSFTTAELGNREEKEKRRILATLKEIAEAFLESEEERDFFFSLLRPKNQELLSSLFPKYLSIAGDLPQAMDRLFGDPKTQETFFGFEEILLVPSGRTPSRFLEEFKRRMQATVPADTKFALWNELQAPYASRRPLKLEGNTASVFLKLAKKAKHLSQSKEVGIAFGGSSADRMALRLALSHFHIALEENLVPLPEAPEGSSVTPWKKIRTTRPISWPRRIGISRQWKHWLEVSAGANPSLVEETASIMGERLRTANLVSEEEKAFLQTPSPEATPLPFANKVTLLPLREYPHFSKATVLYFINPATNAESFPSLFSGWERERLWDSGFPLPSQSDNKPERRMARLAEIPSQKRNLFFVTGNAESFSAGRSISLSPSKNSRYFGDWDSATFQPPPTLSASGLTSFQSCQASYFFSRRLALRTQEKLWEQGALIFGSLAHTTLEKWIGEPQKSVDSANSLFATLFNERFPMLSTHHPLRLSLAQQFEEVAPALPEIERELGLLFGERRVLGVEVPFRIESGGAVFTGRMDRVDCLSNDTLLVLDYKTGSVDFTPDHITDGRDYQSLLYLLAAQIVFRKPVGGFLYYDLKKKEVRRGMVKKDSLLKGEEKRLTRGHALEADKWETLLADAHSSLAAILTKIVEGKWRPNPSSDCDSCPFLATCRRGKPWQN